MFLSAHPLIEMLKQRW